ncbi:MAG: nucleoside triphosphate pyrophosphohydrolase [Pseudomonadota bacterium]
MTAIDRLRSIMAELRDPETGCPWDLEQTMSSIVSYTIEEAYEVADAVERGDVDEIRDELGDLLFQSVFLARLAEEQRWFDFDAVANVVSEKLLRRHPHVFATAASARPDSAAVTESWEAIKAAERDRRSGARAPSELDDVPVTLPALQRAEKIGKRAGRVGFDWGTIDAVFAKLDEEIAELKAALQAAERSDLDPGVRAEAGDVLLTVVSLCRHAGVSAERALREANTRFSERFRRVERLAADAGAALSDLDAAQLDTLWERSKAGE